jgi:hypothetical protein
MFRNRISSVYVVSGTKATSIENPKTGTRSANAARLGMVYSTPVTAVTGP